MKKSKFSESQIVNILKEAEAGVSVEDLSRSWQRFIGGKSGDPKRGATTVVDDEVRTG